MIERLKLPFQNKRTFWFWFLNFFLLQGLCQKVFENSYAYNDDPNFFAFFIGFACSFFTFPSTFNYAVKRGWIKAAPVGKDDATASKKDSSGASTSSATSRDIPMTVAHAYEVLGLHHNCSNEQVNYARKQLVTKWHPDKLGDVADELKKIANDKLAEINNAYDAIQEHRSQYQGAN